MLPPTAWHLLVLGKLQMPPPPERKRPQTQETALGLDRNGSRVWGSMRRQATTCPAGSHSGARTGERESKERFGGIPLIDKPRFARLISPTSHY